MLKRRFIRFVLAAFVFLIGGILIMGWTTRLPNETQTPGSYRQNQALYLTMRDGVKIAIDVWLPANLNAAQKIPTILLSTRYARATQNTFIDRLLWAFGQRSTYANYAGSRSFNNAGYALVLVDARGSGASFGTRPIEWSDDEVADLGEVIDWIAAQPWSNGRVGANGNSYDGNTAEYATISQRAALRAVAPKYSDFDPQFFLAMPGGVFNQWFIQKWNATNQALDANDICGAFELSGWNCLMTKLIAPGIKPVDADRGGSLLAQAAAGHKTTDLYSLLQSIRYRDDTWGPTGYDAQSISPYGTRRAAIEASGVPMYVRVSWLDAATADGALSRYLTFSNPQQLTIGPWSHGGDSNADPFLAAGSPTDPSIPEQNKALVAFFDKFLKAGGNGAPEHSITYYTLGEGVWKTTPTWPPVGFTAKQWYFGPNNTLVEQPPATDQGSDPYAVDFTASTGNTNRWHTQFGGDPVVYPDRARADKQLLTYTSQPMSTDMEITGSPIITLYVSSTATDGAFYAYLEDVAPDGRVTYITEGLLRAIQRKISTGQPPYVQLGIYHSYLRADSESLTPGQVTSICFNLFATSVLIRKGHAIRIALAGADTSQFERIPADTKPLLTFYRTSAYASAIMLPVKEKP